MLTARMILILCPPISNQAAVETIVRAYNSAAYPSMLRFALPHTMAGLLNGLPEGVVPVYYDAAQGLCGVLPQLTDETHFLFITGPHAFVKKWDAALYALSRRCGRQTLFTASITPCTEGASSTSGTENPTLRIPSVSANRIASLRQAMPALQKLANSKKEEPRGILPQLHHSKPAASAAAQAHLPALKELLEDGSVSIGRGLALVCAEEPVRTMVIDPCFLFGPVTFLMEDAPLDSESLSLSAYLTGFSIYALHEAYLWPLKGQPKWLLRLPPPETLPGTTLARFQHLLGFHGDEQRCDAKAAMGLFGHEDAYPQRTPGNVRIRHKLRSARMKLFEMHMPLMVSAYIDLPNPRVTAAFYLLRFGFLRRIQSLPLLLYTGGSQERALRAAFPHTQSYPDNTLLPKELLQNGMKADEAFVRSKVLLLNRAAKRQIEFTHAAWVDMDILPHPVCADAVPNFEPLMDDRIHMATVNGIPDPSFMVIPTQMLPALSKLVLSTTLLDAELKRGFGEPLLWERIFHQKPQWFAIHPMPKRRMLFLTAFDSSLISRSLQPFLTDLPKPYYATEADGKTKKERNLNA